jgi:Protein phosphatase 2C
MSFRSPSPVTRVRVDARADIGCMRTTCARPTRTPSSSRTWARRSPGPRSSLRPADGPELERWSVSRPAVFPAPAPAFASLETPAGVLLAVIDGIGGHRARDIAAQIAADTFRAALSVAPPSGEDACRRRLVAAMNGASRAMVEAAHGGPTYCYGLGATAALALVSGGRLHVVSAGRARPRAPPRDHARPLGTGGGLGGEAK